MYYFNLHRSVSVSSFLRRLLNVTWDEIDSLNWPSFTSRRHALSLSLVFYQVFAVHSCHIFRFTSSSRPPLLTSLYHCTFHFSTKPINLSAPLSKSKMKLFATSLLIPRVTVNSSLLLLLLLAPHFFSHSSYFLLWIRHWATEEKILFLSLYATFNDFIVTDKILCTI